MSEQNGAEDKFAAGPPSAFFDSVGVALRVPERSCRFRWGRLWNRPNGIEERIQGRAARPQRNRQTFARSCVRACVRSFLRAFVRSFVRSFIRSFARLFVRSLRGGERSELCRVPVRDFVPPAMSHALGFVRVSFPRASSVGFLFSTLIARAEMSDPVCSGPSVYECVPCTAARPKSVYQCGGCTTGAESARGRIECRRKRRESENYVVPHRSYVAAETGEVDF